MNSAGHPFRFAAGRANKAPQSSRREEMRVPPSIGAEQRAHSTPDVPEAARAKLTDDKPAAGFETARGLADDCSGFIDKAKQRR